MSNEELITQSELMKRLKISRSKLYRLRQDGLPGVEVGVRGLRFEWTAVRQWLELQRKEKGQGA